MEVRKTGERPTEEQSKSDIKTKSDSNEDPKKKPPQWYRCLIDCLSVRLWRCALWLNDTSYSNIVWTSE